MGLRGHSTEYAPGGGERWHYRLAYGVGSAGSGLLGEFGLRIGSGFELSASYNGISLASDNATFTLKLVWGFNWPARHSAPTSDVDKFRQQGGIWLRPYLDAAQNLQMDQADKPYLDNLDLLLIINKRPLIGYRPLIQANGAYITLPPGEYRIDLDPAGYPLDWQPHRSAYAVTVRSGAYTPLAIPFVANYTVAGRVLDQKQTPVVGVSVEAIDPKERRIQSITNGAGLFFLEGLSQGQYRLQLNGQAAKPAELRIDKNSETYQEVDLWLLNNH
jgi:hypothetical protein